MAMSGCSFSTKICSNHSGWRSDLDQFHVSPYQWTNRQPQINGGEAFGSEMLPEGHRSSERTLVHKAGERWWHRCCQVADRRIGMAGCRA